jgi:hypothetical protein
MPTPTRPAPRAAALLAAALLGGCATFNNAWDYLTTERPPYPLRAIGLTSDVRLDSVGAILGSFVGNGTNNGIVLLSSDTGFIAELLEARRPDLVRDRDTWSALARYGPIRMDPPGGVQDARVASPFGHSTVRVEEIVLRGSSCGWRGAKAEIYVTGPRSGSRAPSLRGPIVGSFQGSYGSDSRWRDAPPRPTPELEGELIARTTRDMDSVLAVRLPRAAGPLETPNGQRLMIDPLEDIDAAEVVPVWVGTDRVRYAVAIRARRITPAGETLLASTVMIWAADTSWRQTVLSPTVVLLHRGQLREYAAGGALPLYWRRLDAISGFGMDRDYLFVEQVDVAEQSVLWGAIEVRSNDVVGAAEVGGACSDR